MLEIIGIENIHLWTAAIDKGGDAFAQLLTQRGWKGDLERICSRIMPLKNMQHNSSQLKEIFRTPLKGLCIPGSSLKGAIKTAIFNSFMDEEFLKKVNINQIAVIKEKSNWKTGEIYNDYKFEDKIIEKKLFGSNANEKSTRFLKIGDINIENQEAEVHEIKVLNKYGTRWDFKNGQQILIETIPAGANAEFDFILDKKLLNENMQHYPEKWNKTYLDFLIEGKSNLCETINSFTKLLIKTDYNTLKNEKLENTAIDMLNHYANLHNSFKTINKSNEFIIRIGGNSGYLFTTGQWVENQGFNIADEDYFALRKVIQKRDYSNMEIWPKTRKISSSGQVFGFVKITLRDD